LAVETAFFQVASGLLLGILATLAFQRIVGCGPVRYIEIRKKIVIKRGPIPFNRRM
jgi:hypothetical protein